MGFFPYMGEILWVFLTFMEVFPIPPLSRGRSGGGWGIYVAVVLESVYKPTVSKKVVIPAKAGIQSFQDLLDAGSSPA
jgi:hypothetical protein